MLPFPYQHHMVLPVLRQTEQTLISKVQFIMKCYRLEENLLIIILRKRDQKDPTNYKDFKVRREAIRMWLCFLRKHNPVYREVQIDDDLLLSLPEDGCIAEIINKQIEEELESDIVSAIKTLSAVSQSSRNNEEDVPNNENLGPEQVRRCWQVMMINHL